MSESSLVIQTSFLGDMVLTTPLLAHLAESRPGRRRMHAGSQRRCWRIIRPCANASCTTSAAPTRGARGFLRMACGAAIAALPRRRTWRRARCAAARSRCAAGIADRVGFQTSAGRAFYTTRIAAPENIHHAARLLSLGTRDPLREIVRTRASAAPLPRRRRATRRSTRCSSAECGEATS